MPKLQTFLFYMLLAITSYSQDKVSVYKTKADILIANYFDKSLIPYIKCTDVVIYGMDSSMLFYSDYQHAKNRKEKLSSVEFNYSFFSKVLNYNFNFPITVARNKKVQLDSLLFMAIPYCIAKNIPCNFITKDSALKLAIKDSIAYPKNLRAELYKHYKSDSYFWFVTGRPITKTPQKKRTATKRTTTNRSSPKNERIINAQTSEMIPYKEYFKH